MAGVGAPPQGCGIIDAMSSQATPTADGGGRSSRPLKASSQPTHPAAPSGRQCSPAHDWTPSQFRPRTARDAYAHRDERANTPANLKQRKHNVREYTLGEEIANSISHGVGALLAIAAIPVLVVASLNAGGGIYLVTALVYTITMLLEYTMSTLYHAIAVDEAKRVFKVLDHSGIYLLIAGTYTPYCLITLGHVGGVWLAAFVWAVSLVGIAFEAFWTYRPRWISAVLYVALGWSIVFFIPTLFAELAPAGFWLLVAGGISYTVGAVFYIFKKVRYMHSIFHLFVLAASCLQFFSVYFFVI